MWYFTRMAIDKNSVSKEAQKFVAKGQFDKAIAEWKKLLKENPDDASIFNTIGDLCLKKDSKAEAVDAYKRAADILAADGFSSKAIALYKKVLNIDPKKIEAHLALGDLNAEKGLTGNALESYKVVVDHYMLNGDTSAAFGIYQKMADLNPSNIGFRVKLADMYAKAGMAKEAVKTYLDAADAHIEKAAYQEARQLFEKILAVDPGNKLVYNKAGIVYFKEGKFVEACKAFKPAVEADPSDKELLERYLEALSRAGKPAEAEEIYRKLLSQDAGRLDLREKLYQACLAKKDFPKAFAEATVIADARVVQQDSAGAIDLLKSFVAAAPHLTDARRKLGELYITLNRIDEAASEFLEASALLSADNDREGAKAALHRIIDIAPNLPEVRKRLESLETHVAAAPVIEIPEPAPVQPVQAEAAAQVLIPEPPPAAPAAGAEDPAVTGAMTEVDVLIKYGLTTKALEQLESLAINHPESILIRVKLRDLYGDQGNMGKSAIHAMALADLYAQQGSPDQAEAELRSALEMDPKNKAILTRLGMAPVAEPELEPAAFAPVMEESILEAPPATAPAEFLMEGPVLEEPRVAAPPPEFVTEEPVFEAPPVEEVAHPAVEIPLEELPSEIEMPPSALEEAPPPAPEVTEEISFAGLDEPPPSPEEEWVQETLPEEIAALPPREPVSEEPPAAIEPEAPLEPPVQPIDLNELWSEAEFYFQQGLFDEARLHYEKILEHAPHDQRARDRVEELVREKEETHEFSKLAEAVEGLEELVSSETSETEHALSTSESDEEAVRSLMQEIEQLKKKTEPVVRSETPPPAAKQPLKTPEPVIEIPMIVEQPAPAHASAEEDFFDLGEELRDDAAALAAQGGKSKSDSEDFFDLAAELRDDLGGVSVPDRTGLIAEDQSLDDIFEDFKKGVEQQEVKQDLDTHYNLGIAYKELGLLDDAIAEFVVTPEGESKFVQSRYMLGLCYMEQGDYHKAIAEIRNAVNYSDSLGGDWQEQIGMHYDLGLAYQGAGNRSEALNEFQTVFDSDPEYRDAGAKVSELQQGGFISMEQLKDDIEKEISTKFLEEGERIGREEKTRKNEKSRR